MFSDGTINSLVLGNTLYERLESEDCSSFVASPDFSLSASPASLSIVQGSSGASTIMINRVNGFNGSVNLSASGLPSGVTVGFAPNPATTTSTLTLTVSPSEALGTSTVTITGVSGALSHQTTIQLTVTRRLRTCRYADTDLPHLGDTSEGRDYKGAEGDNADQLRPCDPEYR